MIVVDSKGEATVEPFKVRECVNCGKPISRIPTSPNQWRWAHPDDPNYQNETGDLGIPCRLNATPIR